MKRYLTCYSKNTLTIRDRVTGHERCIRNCDKEIAELLQTAITQANYEVSQKKASEIKTYSIDDEKEWLESVEKSYVQEFIPEKIVWKKQKDIEVQETIEHIKTLTDKLEELLKGV